MNRRDCIAWLVANDPNGCWSDEDCISEGFKPLTLELARAFIAYFNGECSDPAQRALLESQGVDPDAYAEEMR